MRCYVWSFRIIRMTDVSFDDVILYEQLEINVESIKC